MQSIFSEVDLLHCSLTNSMNKIFYLKELYLVLRSLCHLIRIEKLLTGFVACVLRCIVQEGPTNEYSHTMTTLPSRGLLAIIS